MKNLRISQKLIISLIIISILPYALISYHNYSAEKAALERETFSYLSVIAEAKNTHVSTVVKFRIAQVKEIATSNFIQEIENGNTGFVNLNFIRIKNEIPDFLEISALDLKGKVVASTEGKLIDTNYAEEGFFKKAKEDLYLGNMDYYDNRTAFMISYPVLNRSTGKLIGVVAVRIDPRFIYDVTSDYTGLGESGESLLVQKRGNEVIFLNPLRHNPDAALRLRFPLDSNLAMPAILASKGERGTTRALDYRGKEVFAAHTYIPIIDWGLVVKIDSSEALIPVTKFRDRSIALGIFYFAVVVALAYLFSRRLTSPLIRLSIASKKVAKGDLTVQIEPESRDEIGELSLFFNDMVIRLKELYEGLEQKVNERTAELTKAMELLKEQQKAFMEVSVPVVKVWSGILLVPLIGVFDSARAQLLMETLLTEIENTQAEVVILDVSGIPIVDSLVAKHLIRTVSAAKLMGAECIITGIRPKISQTIVQLGIDLSGITTRATLADGLKVAFDLTNQKSQPAYYINSK